MIDSNEVRWLLCVQVMAEYYGTVYNRGIDWVASVIASAPVRPTRRIDFGSEARKYVESQR